MSSLHGCRLPGRSMVIRQLQEMFDRGERPALTADDPANVVLDTHTVASLLKSYLRELPEPLVPYDIYEPVMTIITREVPVVGERRAAMKLGDLLASRLSQANYNTLHYVCQFLADVADCSEDNKMNVTNLATIFAQCFLRPDAGDDQGLMLATQANRTSAAQVGCSASFSRFMLYFIFSFIMCIDFTLVNVRCHMSVPHAWNALPVDLHDKK